jgi:hypothetical protein
MRNPTAPGFGANAASALDEACALWRKGGKPLEDWTNHQLDCQILKQDLYEWAAEDCGEGCRAIALEAANLLPELNDFSRRALKSQRETAAFRADHERRQPTRLRRLRRLENAILGIYSQGRPKTGSPKGRPKGSAPGLAEANADIERIKELWRRTFGRWRRNSSPAVREIAARRNGIKLKKLVEYRKNYPKLSRS